MLAKPNPHPRTPPAFFAAVRHLLPYVLLIGAVQALLDLAAVWATGHVLIGGIVPSR